MRTSSLGRPRTIRWSPPSTTTPVPFRAGCTAGTCRRGAATGGCTRGEDVPAPRVARAHDDHVIAVGRGGRPLPLLEAARKVSEPRQMSCLVGGETTKHRRGRTPARSANAVMARSGAGTPAPPPPPQSPSAPVPRPPRRRPPPQRGPPRRRRRRRGGWEGVQASGLFRRRTAPLQGLAHEAAIHGTAYEPPPVLRLSARPSLPSPTSPRHGTESPSR